MSEVTKRSISALDQCRDFLTAIFDAGDVIEFRPLPPTAGRQWATTAELPAIVDWLLPVNARKSHCYFGANPRTKAGESKETGVALARCLYADFDGGVTVEEAWSRIEAAGMPTPTATVTTGGGVHCWWRLDQPITDHKLHGRLLKAIATTLPSDAAGTAGWPRIMRLPGFVNWKYEHEPAAELVDLDASRVYPLTELTPVKKVMSGSARAFIQHGSVAAGAGRRETMFAVACDLRDHGWTPEEAEAAIMPRMRQFGLSDDALADCPRQIRNAWKREPREVSAQALGTPAAVAKSSTRPKVEEYEPIPVDALPDAAAELVVDAAKAIGCDQAFVLMPLLAVLGSAIGTTRRIELKADWRPLPIVWPVIVAESGSKKSPGADVSLDVVREREGDLHDAYAAELGEHEFAVELYERSKAAWRNQKPQGRQAADEDPPRRPAPPVARRVMVEDTTTEALAVALSENPRGLLLAADELNGWLANMDRYAGKGGGDEAFYLKCYSGRSHNVLRRGGGRLHVRQAALSITGTIQPGVLRRSLSVERKESGLAARMLLAAPPRRPAKWSEEIVSVLVRDCFGQVVRRLYELQPDADEGGRESSIVVPLDREAKRLWIAFYNAHNEEAAGLVGDLLAAWSKMEETAGRLALILHETKVASRQAKPELIDADTMSRALRLTAWFKRETRRVYQILAENDLDQAARQSDDRLAAWIGGQGGAVTPRDALTGCRWIKTADEAEAALTHLVEAGRGRWEDRPPGDKGGRPTRRFALVTSAQPTTVRPKQGFADADTADSAAGEYLDL